MRHSSRDKSLFLFSAVFALVFLALGCSSPGGDTTKEEATEPAAVRVENPSLQLALAAVPPGFALSSSDSGGFRLERSEEGSTGTAKIVAGPEETAGVNLVEAVNLQKEAIEALTDGQFFGQVELGTPWGPAFSTRGRYSDEGGTTIEEIRLLTLHPLRNALLSLIYTYPAANDTKRRLEQAMGLLGELEALESEPAPATTEGEDA